MWTLFCVWAVQNDSQKLFGCAHCLHCELICWYRMSLWPVKLMWGLDEKYCTPVWRDQDTYLKSGVNFSVFLGIDLKYFSHLFFTFLSRCPDCRTPLSEPWMPPVREMYCQGRLMGPWALFCPWHCFIYNFPTNFSVTCQPACDM